MKRSEVANNEFDYKGVKVDDVNRKVIEAEKKTPAFFDELEDVSVKENPYLDSEYKELILKHPGGRPTLYKPEYAEQARRLYLLNKEITDADLAKFFNVSEATVNNWKNEHGKFLDSIIEGRDLADLEVVNSLFKKANGYKKKVTKVFCYRGQIITEDIEEEVEPDVKAQNLVLAVRQGRKWRSNTIVDEDGQLHIIVAAPGAANAWLSAPKPDVPGKPEGSE